MPIGNSGRVVIEIDPELKQELYAVLGAEGLSLKSWFLARVEDHLKYRQQLSLDLVADGTSKIESADRMHR